VRRARLTVRTGEASLVFVISVFAALSAARSMTTAARSQPTLRRPRGDRRQPEHRQDDALSTS
jgi:hypothetical protein